MLDDLKSHFPDVVYHRPILGYDIYSNPEFGDETAYPARVLYRDGLVKLPASGEVVRSRGTVWIAGIPPIGPGDRFRLPHDDSPRVLTLEAFTDENGPHHVKLTFG